MGATRIIIYDRCSWSLNVINYFGCSSNWFSVWSPHYWLMAIPYLIISQHQTTTNRNGLDLPWDPSLTIVDPLSPTSTNINMRRYPLVSGLLEIPCLLDVLHVEIGLLLPDQCNSQPISSPQQSIFLAILRLNDIHNFNRQ